MNAPGVATQSYSRYRVLPSRQIMTTVPRCLCVPTTPLDLIHRMLLKMLCRTSNARWRMAALVPNGTHGLSFSAAPTKVPGTAYRLITSRAATGRDQTVRRAGNLRRGRGEGKPVGAVWHQRGHTPPRVRRPTQHLQQHPVDQIQG